MLFNKIHAHIHRKATKPGAGGIVLIHVFSSRQGGRLSEIDVLIAAVGAANKQKATTTDAAMVHALIQVSK